MILFGIFPILKIHHASKFNFKMKHCCSLTFAIPLASFNGNLSSNVWARVCERRQISLQLSWFNVFNENDIENSDFSSGVTMMLKEKNNLAPCSDKEFFLKWNEFILPERRSTNREVFFSIFFVGISNLGWFFFNCGYSFQNNRNIDRPTLSALTTMREFLNFWNFKCVMILFSCWLAALRHSLRIPTSKISVINNFLHFIPNF